MLGTFAKRDEQFAEGLDKLSELVAGLAERKSDIATRDGLHQRRRRLGGRPADHRA